ncbi:MAG TPA: M24 family metallopeptidase [Kofleriaceae bacterium]|jgi:Xaa-Pro aminopeptidase|nr:M24 family metallopeptidase [Kofleriaceae bacterium]
MTRTLALAIVVASGVAMAQPTDPYGDPKGPAKVDPKKPKKDAGKKDPTANPSTLGNPYEDAPKKDVTPPPLPPADRNPGIPSRVGLTDVVAVQGLLAVQRLDGWLLFDRDGENPIAVRVVAPAGHPTRPWYYLIPAQGEPIALVHSSEQRSFDHLPGKKLTYTNYRELDKQLKVLLAKVKSVAVEYSPKGTIPGISRVDAGTLETIRAAGVNVRSSETLVQYTKAIWGDAGRTAHYVAVHHVVELRKEALAFVTKQMQSGSPVTEYDVQQRLEHGMTMRGLVGSPPVVAAGVNTADPYYVPTADKAATIKRGDLIVISLAAKVDKPDGTYAAQTWCAVADASVRPDIAKAFETVEAERDQMIALITDRIHKHRAVTGAEVDDVARAIAKKAGFGDRIMHRSGHSIDTDLQGGGADLDNFEVKDSRILTPGTGFTVGPGLYFPQQFGVRTEVSVYLAPSGPEVTTPVQDDVEALLKP